MCSSTLSDTANRLRHGSTLCSPTVEKILCRTPFRSGHMSAICARLRSKGKVGVQRGRETAGVPSFLPPPWVRRAPAAGAAILPPSADGESPAEVQRKTSRPERANPPAAVRAPRWVGAEKEPPRQSEHANAVRAPRTAGAGKAHAARIKAKPRFPSVFFFICGGANRSCDRLRGAHRPDGFRCPT